MNVPETAIANGIYVETEEEEKGVTFEHCKEWDKKQVYIVQKQGTLRGQEEYRTFPYSEFLRIYEKLPVLFIFYSFHCM